MCIDEMMNKLNVYQIMVFFIFSLFSISLSLTLSSSNMATPTTTTTAFADDGHHDGGGPHDNLDLVRKGIGARAAKAGRGEWKRREGGEGRGGEGRGGGKGKRGLRAFAKRQSS